MIINAIWWLYSCFKTDSISSLLLLLLLLLVGYLIRNWFWIKKKWLNCSSKSNGVLCCLTIWNSNMIYESWIVDMGEMLCKHTVLSNANAILPNRAAIFPVRQPLLSWDQHQGYSTLLYHLTNTKARYSWKRRNSDDTLDPAKNDLENSNKPVRELKMSFLKL